MAQKVIEHNTILDIEKLTVEAGQIVALVGPVGSGKNTLLKLQTGQMQPTVGSIQIAGLNPLLETPFARCDAASFSARVPLESALPALGVVLGSAGLVLATVVWRIRRMVR